MSTISGVREVNVHAGRTLDENTIVEVTLDKLHERRDIVERYELTENKTLLHVESFRTKNTTTSHNRCDEITETGLWEAMKAVNARCVKDSDGETIASVVIDV